eukprot:11904730-Alexandrium_andersonii.AAC.1
MPLWNFLPGAPWWGTQPSVQRRARISSAPDRRATPPTLHMLRLPEDAAHAGQGRAAWRTRRSARSR